MPLSNFDYSQGGNKFSDIKDSLNAIVSSSNNRLINPSLTGSIFLSGSTAVIGNISQTGSLSVTGSIAANIFTFTTSSGPLPSSQPTWSMQISGSGAAARLYIYNGTNWMSASFSVI